MKPIKSMKVKLPSLKTKITSPQRPMLSSISFKNPSKNTYNIGYQYPKIPKRLPNQGYDVFMGQKLKRFGGAGDIDGDGVPNYIDCQFRNTMRQDTKPNRLLRQQFGDVFQYVKGNQGPAIKRKIEGTFKRYPDIPARYNAQGIKISALSDDFLPDGKGYDASYIPPNKVVFTSGIVDDKQKKVNVAVTLIHELEHANQLKRDAEAYHKAGVTSSEVPSKEYYNPNTDSGKLEYDAEKAGVGYVIDTNFDKAPTEKRSEYVDKLTNKVTDQDFDKEELEYLRDDLKEEQRKGIQSNIQSSFENMEGASEEKQEEWKEMSSEDREDAREILEDTDGDTVPDEYDCQPDNAMRQDFTPMPSYRKPEQYAAATRFGGRNLAGLKKIGSGRDRDVYALDKDKVLKVAKNPGGLTQNTSESDLVYLGMGEQLEAGKDYVVMKRQEPLSPAGKRKLASVRKAISELPNEYYVNRFNYKPNLAGLSGEEGILEKTGIGDDILNYSINPNEVFANRQWGENKQGDLVLVDGGALQDDDSLRRYRVKDFEQIAKSDRERAPPWQLEEWKDVQRQRTQNRDKGSYTGKVYKYQPSYESLADVDNNKFNPVLKPRNSEADGFKVKWYPVDEIIKKHQSADGIRYDITRPENQVGNKLSQAKDFISKAKYTDGFQPPIVDKSGSIIDGRHRVMALKELGYTEIPVEEYDENMDNNVNMGKQDKITEFKKRNEEVNAVFDQLWERKRLGEISGKEADLAFAEAREKYSEPLKKDLMEYRGKIENVKFGVGDTPIARQAFSGEKGHVEYMSPDEFLSKTTKPHVSPDSLINIYEGVKSGNEFQPGFLEVEDGKVVSHEGRHRALAAKMAGIDKIPVAIVGSGHSDFSLGATVDEGAAYKKADEFFETDEDVEAVIPNKTAVVKETISEVGEVDNDGICLGNCEKISQGLKEKLGDNYEVRDVEQYQDQFIKHKALVDKDTGNIIDTQTWQYKGEEPRDIEERKIEYTPEEYESEGFVVSQSTMESEPMEESDIIEEEYVTEEDEDEE